MDRTAWPWAAWAAATLAAFAALERAAYRPGAAVPTLSAVLRYALGIHPPADRRTIRAAIAIGGLTGGFASLAVHLSRVPEPGAPNP